MTRVTNHLRDNLQNKIMAGLPVIDYVPLIHALVQNIVIEHAPAKVKALYADPELRDYLSGSRVEVKLGNKHVPMWQGSKSATDSVKGLTKGITIQMMDDLGRTPVGSLYQTLITKLKESGLVVKYFQQEELRDSVRKRLRANLAASSTFKQLYTNLEPELHHYIPKDEVQAQVPACVAPVVDDLRKLGADLPTVPKAPTA
jgi:hypothetical protein